MNNDEAEPNKTKRDKKKSRTKSTRGEQGVSSYCCCSFFSHSAIWAVLTMILLALAQSTKRWSFYTELVSVRCIAFQKKRLLIKQCGKRNIAVVHFIYAADLCLSRIAKYFLHFLSTDICHDATHWRVVGAWWPH